MPLRMPAGVLPGTRACYLAPAPCTMLTRCLPPLGAGLREVRPRVAAGARRGRGSLAQPLSRLRAGTRMACACACACACASRAHVHVHIHVHVHVWTHVTHACTHMTCTCTCNMHMHMQHAHAHALYISLHTQCIHARGSPNCAGPRCRWGTRQQTEALFAGCILPLWNAITAITATGRHKFLRVTRVRLSTGQRIVGVKVAQVSKYTHSKSTHRKYNLRRRGRRLGRSG